MQILIIGGTGITGPHVARGLVERGHDVTVYHRGHTQTDLPAGVQKIFGDKADLTSRRHEFEHLAPDVVLHMAAFTLQDAETFVQTFRGIAGRAVVISSGDVYLAYGRMSGSEAGPVEAVPLTEDAPLRTKLGPMGEAYNKTAVEAVVRGAHHLPSTILRYPGVYGPRDGYRRLGDTLRPIADQRPAVIIGDGEASFRFAHAYAENAAHATLLAVVDSSAVGRTYNVAEAVTPTGLERARRIATALGWSGQIVVVPDADLPEHLKRPPINLEQHLVMDSSRIRAELGYTEVVSEEEAIRRTYEWQRTHPPDDATLPDYDAEDRLLAAR